MEGLARACERGRFSSCWYPGGMSKSFEAETVGGDSHVSIEYGGILLLHVLPFEGVNWVIGRTIW